MLKSMASVQVTQFKVSGLGLGLIDYALVCCSHGVGRRLEGSGFKTV